MTRFVILGILAHLLSFNGYSQQKQASKTGIRINQLVEKAESPNHSISFFVKGEPSALKAEVANLGGRTKYCHGNICAVEIPAGKVTAFANSTAVERLEDAQKPLKSMMDTSLIHNNVAGIHQGVPPLPMPYTGSGVLIGIIDFGIDFDHPDFELPNGDTRIKYIWDQNVGGTSPQPYNYGAEWTEAQINAGQCTHNEPTNAFGHGTNVSGIAAGDGSAVGDFTGVAPDANLIVVGIDLNTDFLLHLVDAIDYIFTKADSLNMPCVINASVGTYYGSRDAKDLAAQMIDNMITAQTGRVVVAAAGNAGHVPYHLGYDVEQDSCFTWFNYNVGLGYAYWELWADSADFDDVFWSVGADLPSNWYHVGYTQYYNLPIDYAVVNNGAGLFITDAIFDSTGTKLTDVFTYAELVDGVYHLEVFIPNVPTYYWRFTTKGEGRFDVWAHSTLIYHSDIVGSVPPDSVLPEIVRYKFPDNHKTLVSSFTCSDKVITVGNYGNRHHYVDVNGVTRFTGEPVGMIQSSSAHGPTRDNRIKPDLSATGSTSIATGNLANIAALIGSGQGFKVAQGGMHNRNGGTSMASPVVAGAVALYLQKNPTANWQDVKNDLIMNARMDAKTGYSLPDNHWGYGKLNALAFVSDPAVYGCMDVSATNYHPGANFDNGSCIYDCCPSAGMDAGLHWIQKVCVGNTCNVSGDDGGYGDYTSLTPRLQAGNTFSMLLKPGFINPVSGMQWKIWMDLNGNGTFEDSTELLFHQAQPNLVIVNANITVSASASTGQTKMRIQMGDQLSTACDSIPNGEVEDYSVIISEPYCTDTSSTASSVWIETVCADDLCHNSGNDGGYLFKNTSVRLNAGNAYALSLTPGFTGAPQPVFWAVFCDFDRNGSFDDPGEMVLNSAVPTLAIETGQLVVPGLTSNGSTRLRFAVSTEPISDACLAVQGGEVEDYVIRLHDSALSKTGDDPHSLFGSSESAGFQLFPNPTSGSVTLRASISAERADLRIYDLAGKLVVDLPQLTLEGGSSLIDLSRLSPGIYQVELITPDSRESKRLVVMD